MAFRYLVKTAVEREKDKRKSIKPSVLIQEDERQGDATARLDSLLFGALGAAPPARQKTYLEERLSKSQTLAGDPKANVKSAIGMTLSCESSPTLSMDTRSNKQTVECDPEHPTPVVDECPSPSAGLHTYKWAEARLSKSAALAGANWDNPEGYMEYLRRAQKQSPPERRRSRARVAAPSAPRSGVALPREFPPSLESSVFSESPQIRSIQQTQESTVDRRLQTVQSLQTDKLIPTHKLEPSKQAEAIAVAAPPPSAPPPSGIDGSFPAPHSQPRSAWEAEKSVPKCNCVLM
eukprot:TRINITY_DN108342_c0_g1_i1.p1 TRINITY_DN108342_c0_g1~~TRINITY_DN108342_c0_g1_i1.p1  ORF type:complete len:292 (+),score=42.13 TRINITY_DN108342_c0_g1_i1:59-934(+)